MGLLTIPDAQSILSEIDEYYGYAASNYDRSNPDEMMDRLEHLATLLARTAHLLPEVEAMMAQRKAEVSDQYPDMSATRLKYAIEAEAGDAIKLYRYVERLNAAIVHQIDALRTQLSYVKSSMGGANATRF